MVDELWDIMAGSVFVLFVSPLGGALWCVTSLAFQGWALPWPVGWIYGEEGEGTAVTILRTFMLLCPVCVQGYSTQERVNSQEQLTAIPRHSQLLEIPLLWSFCGSGPRHTYKTYIYTGICTQCL